MPVPATTGQLRTKISDMQIGDYIVCNYTASSGVVGTFSNFGGTAGAEIPVSGSSTPNETFYFVKVAKGLLVADRVVQHSITWDTLNARGVIQGTPCVLSSITDAVPTMTSNNTPSGIARSDSILSLGYEPWKAFSDSVDFNGSYTTSGWMSGTATSGTLSTDTCWISYEFPTPKEIKGITLVQLGYNTTMYRCKDFSIQCSDDGTTWQTVYRGIASPNYQKQLYTFNSVGAKKFWRFVIYSHFSTGASAALGIAQLELLEQVPNIGQGIIRSLTGGVAYADANGNKSTTDLGYGGFPTNNEWDKFIVGFPQELIQSGKTLDDVFHWSGVATWCQDTPINGVQHPNTSSDVGQNTERTWRGYGLFTGNSHVNSRNEKMFGFSVSNYTATTLGFRPCFEYIES
jgi:F5/8 type C domain